MSNSRFLPRRSQITAVVYLQEDTFSTHKMSDANQMLLSSLKGQFSISQSFTKYGTQAEVAEEGEAGIEAQVQTYLLESFASGTEGLMLKSLDKAATYQASKRSENWIKLKRCLFSPKNFQC